MYKKFVSIKNKNGSLNLEDPYYDNNEIEILAESVEAVQQTESG